MAPATALAVFAGKSVAASVIKEIISKAFGYLNGYLGAETMAELKRRLDKGMPKIQAVLGIASPDQVRDKALDAWFWQLRDAVEKAEDAIDELEYYTLEEKAHDRKVSDWGSSFAKMKHKAAKQVKNIETVKAFTHRGTLKRLRKAVEDLDRAAESAMDFFTLAEHLTKGCTSSLEGPSLNRDRETASKLTSTEVFGRHKEKELLIRWLTNTSCEDAEIEVSSNHVSIVSIVGHGGMGKTTLAQLVCQDDSVKTHFGIVIWACVSTSFDATTVTTKILESAQCATPNANTLDALQKMLEEKVKSVKFLLILDDVWDDEKIDQWEKLFAPLKEGKSGSKILLTTRMRSVANLAARALASKNDCLALHGLEEDENIELFNRYADASDSFQDDPTLRLLGEQIAKNLRGCPLVTKVVASHLRDNLTFEYWSNFLHQKLEHFGGTAEDIMNVLKLSYYHLPPDMQSCFRYCSMFPQDFVFDKEQLVKMWVSSGLTISQVAVGSESPINTGEQYLDQLTRKSFFDHAIRFGKEKYIMHDLMHDLAKYVSSGECARIVDVANLENVASTVRHIRIKHTNNLPVEKIMDITHLENLRTIVIKDWGPLTNKVTLDIVEQLVERSKSLRLFQTDLQHTSHFVGKLAMLKHLRFVGFMFIPPENICGVFKLYHLTTLECRHLRIEGKQLRDFVEPCMSSSSGTRSLHCPEKLVQNLVRLEVKRVGSCEQLLGLEKFVTLEELKLGSLPRLKKVGRELDVSGSECTELFWPPNLCKLEVTDCPKLKELPLLPPSLRGLYIRKIGLTKLPGKGKPLLERSLFELKQCESLSSLGWLESLPPISCLTISRCSKLPDAEPSLNLDVSGGREEHLVVPRSTLQLDILDIDLPSLLLVEPLNSLCQTKYLGIECTSGMESVPEGWLLQNRSSLKSLRSALLPQISKVIWSQVLGIAAIEHTRPLLSREIDPNVRLQTPITSRSALLSERIRSLELPLGAGEQV
ncbi:putative disease resistance protein RGA4 [Dichanthelium oligosanthes]|uniref:Putative disease resistance protein RGA4 n=1 Tax=Dichanthelium oligosanthes TaxID=888268 RepID=A0A1E5V4C8_9POAL|nr:putative disease resistance protein RGA4 [Dichanthelium oligosanthes]